MSNYTAGQVREARLRYAKTMDRDAVILDMLDAYGAAISKQAEWPSDEDAHVALERFTALRGESPINAMCAALQSVRPHAKPDAGAVPDEDVRIGVRAYNENVVGLQQRVRQVLESYASRHARQVPGELLSALRAAVDNPCDDAYWILQAKTALAKWEKAPPAPEKD